MSTEFECPGSMAVFGSAVAIAGVMVAYFGSGFTAWRMPMWVTGILLVYLGAFIVSLGVGDYVGQRFSIDDLGNRLAALVLAVGFFSISGTAYVASSSSQGPMVAFMFAAAAFSALFGVAMIAIAILGEIDEPVEQSVVDEWESENL